MQQLLSSPEDNCSDFWQKNFFLTQTLCNLLPPISNGIDEENESIEETTLETSKCKSFDDSGQNASVCNKSEICTTTDDEEESLGKTNYEEDTSNSDTIVEGIIEAQIVNKAQQERTEALSIAKNCDNKYARDSSNKSSSVEDKTTEKKEQPLSRIHGSTRQLRRSLRNCRSNAQKSLTSSEPSIQRGVDEDLVSSPLNYTCPYCDIIKNSPAELTRHVKKHSEEKSFGCEVCKKAFKAKRSLQYHQFVQHGPDNSESSSSYKKKSSSSQFGKEWKGGHLQMRPALSKQLQTQSSSSTTATENATKQTSKNANRGLPMRRKSHSAVSLPLSSAVKEADVVKDEPGKRITSRLPKRRSSLAVGAARNQPLPQGADNSSNSGVEERGNCADYKQDNAMSSMTRKQSPTLPAAATPPPPPPPSTPLPSGRTRGRPRGSGRRQSVLSRRSCRQCSKVFPKPSDLKRHMMVHSGEKPFKCEVCSKAFKAKGSMLYHKKVAHGVNVELSQGLEERYLRLKTRAQMKTLYVHEKLQERASTDEQDAAAMEASLNKSSELLKRSESEGEMTTTTSDTPETLPLQAAIASSGTYPTEDDIETMTSCSTFKEELELAKGLGLNDQKISEAMAEASLSSVEVSHLHPQPPPSQPPPSTYFVHPDVSTSPSITTPTAAVCGIGNNTIEPSISPTYGPADNFVITTEAQFTKNRISIKNETVIATRIDGINQSSGSKTSLYKCYLCGKIFNYLSKLQCHLSLHYERHLVTYQCSVCGTNFKFKTQLLRHSRRHKLTPKSSVQVDQEGQLEETVPVSQDTPQLSEGSKESLPFTPEFNEPSTEDDSIKETPPVEPPSANPYHNNNNNSNNNNNNSSTSSSSIGSNNVPARDFVYPYQKVNGCYVCLYCRKSFTRFFSLQRHERIHTGYKPCYCKECGKGFSEYRNLRQHVMRFHSDNYPMDYVRKVRKRAILASLKSSIRLGYLNRLQQRMGVPDMIDAGTTSTSHDELQVGGGGGSDGGGGGILGNDDNHLHHQHHHHHHHLLGRENPDLKYISHVDAGLVGAGTIANAQYISKEQESEQLRQEEEEKEKMNAKEILKKEGIKEDVTVVLPSEPPAENEDVVLDAHHSNGLPEGNWSENTSENGEDCVSSGEIIAAPKRCLLPQNKKDSSLFKSRRKASLTYKVENNQLPASQPHHLPQQQQSQPAAPPPPAPPHHHHHHHQQQQAIPQPQAAHMHPPTTHPPAPHHPSHIAGTQPVVVNSEPEMVMSTSHLGQSLLSSIPQSNMLSSMSALGPITCNSMVLGTPTLPAQAAASFLAASQLLSPAVSQALTGSSIVNIPLGLSAESLSLASSTSSLTGTSQCPSPEDTLVGLPRVQWHSPHSPDSIRNTILADGRKLTSLSRTHSRLHIVNSPVDREKVCKPTLLPDGRAVYRCIFCGKDFLSFSDINRHMDFHEVETGVNQSRHGEMTLEGYTFALDVTKQAPKADIRPYKCKFCDYYARTNSQLKVHMMRHQGIREFCCKLCNYKGVTQSDLNRHMKSQIHMLKSRNECPHCGEGFVTPKNLDKHVEGGNCLAKRSKVEQQ